MLFCWLYCYYPKTKIRIILENKGFTLLEILLAMMFISFSFLPIYNLFRFGTVGTKSNVKEIEATNYAADLINFLRNMSFSEMVAAVGDVDEVFYADDSQIKSVFPEWDLVVPEDFSRTLTLRKFKGNKTGLFGIAGWWDNIINQRRSVPNFLADVRVKYLRPGSKVEEEILLSTIIMD